MAKCGKESDTCNPTCGYNLVPAGCPGLGSCNSLLLWLPQALCLVFDLSEGGTNLTSDPHRHNEKRRLPSPVVDVFAYAHTRYRAVRRDESKGSC